MSNAPRPSRSRNVPGAPRKAPRKNFPQFGGKRLTPSRHSLGDLLQYHGVELDASTLDQLWAFHQLLRANNDDQDLTRLNAFETIVERHYADCTIINAFMDEWPSTMLDIGSGAGFPGIPLKLVNPDVDLTLCEPRPNRVQFLNLVIRELGLRKIRVFGHKATSNSLQQPVDGVITRAFEVMDQTLLRVEKVLKPGGKAIFMKGPAVKEELATFQNPQYKIIGDNFYTIPNSTQDRALIVMQRQKLSV